jgi:hypothetical protein
VRPVRLGALCNSGFLTPAGQDVQPLIGHRSRPGGVDPERESPVSGRGEVFTGQFQIPDHRVVDSHA